MAISATRGAAANSATAVASLALPAFNVDSGQDVYCTVTLGSTSSAVTSITNSKACGTWDASALVAKNGTGVRVEIWHLHVTSTQTSNVITVNLSPNTTISAEAEEYAGVSAQGSTATASGSSIYPRAQLATTQGNNFILGALGFVTGASTTQTAQNGTSRQASIGASAVGGALYDSTQVGDGTLVLMTLLNASQQWASAAIELKTGGAAISYEDYATTAAAALQASKDVRFLRATMPPMSSALPSSYAPFPVGAQLKGGTSGTAYSETISAHGGTSPYTFAVTSGALPTSTSMSSAGAITGTPTVAGSYSFTVTVTDHDGYTGSQAFSITIDSPPSAAGGNFGYTA